MKNKHYIIFYLLLFLFCVSSVGCKNAVKSFSKSTAESIAKNAEKNTVKAGEKEAIRMAEEGIFNAGEKRAVKVMVNGALKEVPVGKESLKVIRLSDGRYVPAINNLNEFSVKYSEEFNKLLFKNRRNALTNNHQYISPEDLSKTKPKANLTEASSASILRKNMYARMNPENANIAKAFGGTQAHHIVEGTAPAAEKSREILKKFRLGINDAENGVLLRSDGNSIYKGALHNTNHSEKYSEYVYSKIKNVKSQEELILKLSEIKKELVYGTLDLAGNVRPTKNKLHF